MRRRATLPPGFDDQLVASVPEPTALGFVPDGRLLIASQRGQLYVFKDGALNPTPALDLAGLDRVCNDHERGLLGVAVDPGFADQHFVYLYYSFKKFGTCGNTQATAAVNRISRFTLGSDDIIDPASEEVLVDNIPSPSGIHNSGDLHFGKDGYLYASVGDGCCDWGDFTGCGVDNDAAQDLSVLSGKILRITADGGIPLDNPYLGPGTARCNQNGKTTEGTTCQEIYARGLRNPFRLAFDPNASGTSFYINDVGQDNWEEIDVGQAGANYGWNVREGHCVRDSTVDCGPQPPGMTNPIYSYDHSAGCTSIIGGAFVPNGVWPAQYDGSYFFADSTCGKVFQLVHDVVSAGYSAVQFASDLGDPVGLVFGPFGSTQALYYLYYGDPTVGNGQVRSIAYTGSANRLPTARASASPTAGDLPLTVDFDGTASSDPDNNSLTYDWDFGDGSAHGSGATTSHTYDTAGTYTAKLQVDDGNGGQNTTTIRVDAGDNPPVPTIDTPTTSDTFSVGQDITLAGHATDPEDGALPDSALTWHVIKHHASHTHPFLPTTPGNDVHITGPQPEDLMSTTNSYLEISLTATDSHGLTSTVKRDLMPRLVDVTLQTDPTGLQLDINGDPVTAPFTLRSWAGWDVTVNAPDQRDADDQGQTFAGWFDGGNRSHTITTGTDPVTYTAAFSKYYPRPKGATPTRFALVPAYRSCTSPNRGHSPPLATPSCDPPQQTSDYLTVGTGDANGATPNEVGSMRFAVVQGNPNTTADEADVKLRLSITDVRSAPTLVDYTGELGASVDMRITDRYNGTSLTDSGTTQDAPLQFTVPCTVTVSTTIGSTCSTNTTADALAPGTVVENNRAIWQLGQFLLYDGGADGLVSTAPNTLFADAGLFVP